MKIFKYVIPVMISLFFISCSSSKTSTGSLPATHGNLKGTWTITDIQVNMPAGVEVTNVFNEAPYTDFQNSTWELIRNGKGSFALTNGKKEDIYWSISGTKANPQFQFKILNGQKAAKVEEGYRLSITDLQADEFKAVSSVPLAEGKSGAITYTFTRKSS